MWKKTKEMKWKTENLLWGDLFYEIAGAVQIAAGVYTFAGHADFRNTYSFYKSAPYRDQLSYTGETFSFENGEINGDHNIFS